MKVVIANDTSHEMHHGCSKVMGAIYRNIYKRDGTVIDSFSVGLDWRKSEEFKKKLLIADVVIVNGEGTIHHNSPKALWLLELALFCNFYNKKCYLINALVQEISDEYLYLFKLFSGVYVRDSYSQRFLEEKKIESKLTADLTFYMEDISLSNNYNIPSHKLIGFTCSVSPDNTYRLYKESLRYEHGIFMPIIYQTNVWAENSSINLLEKFKKLDFKTFCVKAYSSVGLKYQLNSSNKYSDYKTHVAYGEAINDLSYLYSGRFHSLCFAIVNRTPFTSLSSNSHKIEALIHDVGLNPERLVKGISELREYPYSSVELDNISAYIDKANAAIKNMFDDILGEHNG